MQRVSRRWWTWSVSILAVLVVLATLISSVFQLAVLALPNYRDDLSAWVSEVAGRPVQIGGVNLVWRGFSPRLDLADITLYTEDGADEALTADRLSLGFSLTHLLVGDYKPTRVVLSGLELGVQIDADGNVTIAGFAAAPQRARTDLRSWLKQFERFAEVRLQNCVLNLEDERIGGPMLAFTVIDARLRNTLGGLAADGTLRLPPSYGSGLNFRADVRGPVAQPEKWSGRFSLDGSGLMPQPWLRGHVAPATRVGARDVAAHISGALRDGHLDSASLSLDSGALNAERDTHRAAARSLNVRAQLARDEQGWQVDLRQFAVDGSDAASGALRYLPLGGGDYELDADGATLRLDALAPWLAFVRDAPAPLAQLGGQASGVVLRLRRTPEQLRYAVRASLRDITLAGDGDAPGFSGVSGELSAEDGGGRFILKPAPMQLRWPKTFARPLPFKQVAGDFQWTRSAQGWRVSSPEFKWDIAGAGGHGTLDLALPQQGSPLLNLSARFAVADLTALKPYMPGHWSEHLRQWLERGIERGKVTHAELEIHGPVADFPYAERSTGEWRLDLAADDARLNYAEHWPPIDDLQAQVHFRNNTLSVTSSGGNLAGNKIERVDARFGDLRERQLTVDGSVNGETRRYYEFLRASPLAQTLAGLLTHTRAAGPAKVEVHLDIPLHDAGHTVASGRVALGGVQLYYGELREPINDIRGELAFTADGVTAQHLNASFEDLPLTARIEARAQTRGVVLIDFPYTPKADGSGVSSYVPELLRRALSGQSRWRAELPLGVERGALTLTSDLRGTAVALPKPLNKTTADAAPISIVIGGDAEPPLHVRVGYDNRVAANVAVADDATGAPAAVNLHLGAGAAPPPPAQLQGGIVLEGETPELDLAAWNKVLRAPLADAETANAKPGLSLRRAEVRASRLLYGRQGLRDTHVLYTPSADGWTATLNGVGAQGQLGYTRVGGGRLDANFARMDLEGELVSDTGKPGDNASVLDPSAWPTLDLSCGACKVEGADFGALRIATSRIAGGQRLDNLRASGGKIEANASGQWLRTQNQSSAKLKMDLSSSDFAALLKSLGFAQNISAKTSKLSGELEWAPAPAGIAWEQARGKLTLDFKNGVLKAVEPGAGRVLALLNFYALPRRLTLDFRDVVNSGLTYDHISGSFALADGVATTNDVEIKALALRMEMRGRVGLAARDYDERISVYPDVSSGITLGAALLGGPALAALVFIAQEVLDKPLEQATQLSYQVTGSWDNPEVKRIEPRAAPKPVTQR